MDDEKSKTTWHEFNQTEIGQRLARQAEHVAQYGATAIIYIDDGDAHPADRKYDSILYSGLQIIYLKKSQNPCTKPGINSEADPGTSRGVNPDVRS